MDDEDFLRLGDVSLVSSVFKTDKQTLEQFSKLGNNFINGVQAIVYKNGQLARDMARKLAPKKTGGLRASIYVSSPSKGGMNATSISPQAYAGYFRAITAASKKNARLGIEEGEYLSHYKTQRRKKDEYKISNVKTSSGNVIRALASVGGSGFGEQLAPFPLEMYKKEYFYVIIGAAAFYAAYVEYGTVHRKPTPFIAPSAEWAHKKNIEDIKKYAEAFLKAKKINVS